MSYYYFISSLPEIRFGQEPPIPEEDFLSLSLAWLPTKDYNQLAEVAGGRSGKSKNEAVKKWHNWETALRNSLVSARAHKTGIEPGKYLRGTEFAEAYVRSAAQELIKIGDQKKAEKELDLLRWRYLDELSAAHSFDFNVALSYLLKLKILSRWARLDEGAGKEELNKNLKGKYKETQ